MERQQRRTQPQHPAKVGPTERECGVAGGGSEGLLLSKITPPPPPAKITPSLSLASVAAARWQPLPHSKPTP
jgi:hypothetical protein